MRKFLCFCFLLFVFSGWGMIHLYAAHGVAVNGSRLASFINNPGNQNMDNTGHGSRYAILKNGQGIGVHIGSGVNVSDVEIMLASSSNQTVVIHVTFYPDIDSATGRGKGTPIATIRQRHSINASPTMYSTFDLACESTNSETAKPYTQAVKNVACIEVTVAYRTDDALNGVHIYQVLPYRRYSDDDSRGRYILDLKTASVGSYSDDVTHNLKYRDHCDILCYFAGGRPNTTSSSATNYYTTTNADVADISTYSSSSADYVRVIAKKKGTATLTIHRKESWQYEAISRTYTFKITARSITDSKISASYSKSFEYNGKARTPTITMTDTYNTADGFPETLTQDTHFTVSYSNNTNAGEMSATVKGDGTYYTGSVTYRPEILPRELTLTFTANDKTYDGTKNAVGNFNLERVVSGDEVSARGTCTFSDALAGENKTVTAKSIVLEGADSANYSIVSTAEATADIFVNTGLAFSCVSPFENHVAADLLTQSFTQAAQNAGITLPGTYTTTYGGGTFGSVSSGVYNRNNTYADVLGVLEDKLTLSLTVSGVLCATGTAQITTGTAWVYGTNSTEAESGIHIIAYENEGHWGQNGTTKTIATGAPEGFVVRAYLKKGEWLLVDTDIGIYHGRVDVAVDKGNQHYADDKIDAFFPVSYQDDYRVSKLQLADNTAYNAARDDYWTNLNPFVAEEAGIYTFSFTVTGTSYLLDTEFGLGAYYAKNPENAPANAPRTTVRKLSIGAAEAYGVDAM